MLARIGHCVRTQFFHPEAGFVARQAIVVPGSGDACRLASVNTQRVRLGERIGHDLPYTSARKNGWVAILEMVLAVGGMFLTWNQ
jgi:hypothetical protein